MPALGTALGLPFVRKAGPLTPPTVAPELMAEATFGNYDAFLEWTASNKTGSDGFRYVVYVRLNADPESVATYSNDLSFIFEDLAATGGSYAFRIVPENSAGQGPSSNTVSVILPGT